MKIQIDTLKKEVTLLSPVNLSDLIDFMSENFADYHSWSIVSREKIISAPSLPSALPYIPPNPILPKIYFADDKSFI